MDEVYFVGVLDISIHAPREGRDSRGMDLKSRLEYFNPRAPRGARQDGSKATCRQRIISIHAPREGRDCKSYRQTTG